MASQSKVLYTGVTNNLERRVYEHKKNLLPGFFSRYRTGKLVYFEATSDIRSAIEREKQIKGWLRAKKVALIKSANPGSGDLSTEWYADFGPALSKMAEIKKTRNALEGDVRSQLNDEILRFAQNDNSLFFRHPERSEGSQRSISG